MKQLKYSHQSKETRYLIEKDPTLQILFDRKNEIIVTIDDDYFVSLVTTIISQQLSSKVASVIYKRVLEFFDNQITPDQIMNASDENLRSLGLSFPKIKYLKSLAQCIIDQTVDLSKLEHLSNEEVIEMLTKIKGIGPWSAQMFLIFSLGREDVFSVLDLGLRNAVKIIYKNPDLTHQEIEEISKKWMPYRSIVSHYLWHAWDNEA
ncbi:MAG: DNA-3-methyladenine glycosylase [Tenericutes bacterium]|nr:DNA-3-methyladenine glycosylase [Mycoplasmatota bacterium]